MAQTREQIAAAATQAIQKAGVHSVSFRTLAEAIGVKSSSVHYHFPTKQDLTLSLVQQYSDEFADKLNVLEHADGDLEQRLQEFIDIFESVLARDDLCLCGMLAAELAELDGASVEALRAFFRLTEQWLEQQLVSSERTLTMPASALARVVLAGLEGAILLDRAEGGTAHLDAFRELARTMLT